MPHDQYQTVHEVADRLKVNDATVRRWIKDRELRAINIGKGWRIADADLVLFLRQHETRTREDSDDPGGWGGAHEKKAAPSRKDC